MMTITVRSVCPSAFRRRRARLGVGVIAGAAALALVGATPALAAPAVASPGAAMAHAMARLAPRVAAKTIFQQDLQSFVAKTTTTTGVKLYVSFTATRVPSFPKLASAQIVLDTVPGTEGHLWSFPVGKTALVTKPSGAGSFKTGAAFGSYGSVSVTFTPTASKRIDVCDASNYTLQQTERVKGKLYFDTHSTGSHAWGKVGSTSRSFAFSGLSDLFTYYIGDECVPKSGGLGACYNEVSWSAGNQKGTVSFSGSAGTGTRTGSIDAIRYLNLSTPKGATRLDAVDGAAPNPVLSRSGKAAKVKVTTLGGAFRGSATVDGTKGITDTSKCKTGTLIETDWTTGTTYKASTALSAHEQIFGTIRLPAKVKASITVVKS